MFHWLFTKIIPKEIGMGRLLAAIGAVSRYPNQPVDTMGLGAVIMFTVVSPNRFFDASPIIVGMKAIRMHCNRESFNRPQYLYDALAHCRL